MRSWPITSCAAAIYDDSLGRFLSRDPRFELAEPNHYIYVGSRPTLDRDPLGLFGLIWTCTYQPKGGVSLYPIKKYACRYQRRPFASIVKLCDLDVFDRNNRGSLSTILECECQWAFAQLCKEVCVGWTKTAVRDILETRPVGRTKGQVIEDPISITTYNCDCEDLKGVKAPDRLCPK